MAEIEYAYKDATHTIKTFDDIVSTYNWIHDALCAVCQNRKELNIHCTVAFSTDEMSYECSSIDEFKKYAFGKDIEVKRMLVYASENWLNSLVDVFATYNKEADIQKFVLSSKDEMMIINLKEALLTNKEAQPKQKDADIMQIVDNSVHIGSNNQISNSVIGSKNTSKIKQINEVSENKKETLISKSFWQILVPIVVGVIVAIIIFYFGLN